MSRDKIGPWFKCWPEQFLSGISDLNPEQVGFYTFLILWQYNEADAVYLTDQQLGKYLNSNAAPARRVRAELIALKKFVVIDGGGLVNPKALRVMMEQIADRPRSVPARVKARIAAIYAQFEAASEPEVSENILESFENVLENIRETREKKPLKTTPPYKSTDLRGRVSDKKINQKRFLALCPEAGTPAADLFAAVTEGHSLESWGSWFSDRQAQIEGQTVYARTAYIRSTLAQRFGPAIAAAGFTLSADLRPAAPARQSAPASNAQNSTGEAQPARAAIHTTEKEV